MNSTSLFPVYYLVLSFSLILIPGLSHKLTFLFKVLLSKIEPKLLICTYGSGEYFLGT